MSGRFHHARDEVSASSLVASHGRDDAFGLAVAKRLVAAAYDVPVCAV